ncbi:MAG: protein kinase domain-containing protein, partial [bacterium]
MGEVHRAFDRQLGHEVALKRMRVSNPESTIRLKAEFRARAEIHHPNLLQVFDLVVSEDVAFFTMEIVDGFDLTSWVDQLATSVLDTASGHAATRRLARVLAPVAGALAALHDAGLLHRDVKPDNILISADGRALLADLGLAVGFITEAGRPSRPPLRAGTLAYMAPEILLRRRPTPASDLFSLGVVLREATFALALTPATADTATRGLCADLVAALEDHQPGGRPSALTAEARLYEIAGARVPARLAALKRKLGREAFVGRDRELGQIAHAMQGPRMPDSIHVYGPSGIGKTAFVARLLEQLVDTTPELRVLRGRCRRHEQVAFGGLDGVIDDLAVHLQQPGHAVTLDERATQALLRLFPILPLEPRLAHTSAPTEPDARLRLAAFGALRGLLVTVAAVHPLVVWLDDLQWAGDDTWDLLAWLRTGDGIPGCTMVLTYRPEEPDTHPGALLRALARPDGPMRDIELHLPPLAESE